MALKATLLSPKLIIHHDLVLSIYAAIFYLSHCITFFHVEIKIKQDPGV